MKKHLQKTVELRKHKVSKEITDAQIEASADMDEAMALCIENFVNQIDTAADRFDRQYIFSSNLKVKDDENEMMQSFVATDMDDLYFGAFAMAMNTFVDIQQRANETMGSNDFFEQAPSAKRLRGLLKEVEIVKEHIKELGQLMQTHEAMRGE